MDRMGLYHSWRGFYAALEPSQREVALRERIKKIEGRMILLARFPQRMYKGFAKAKLVTSLGMSLGVHKQLLWGLTSVPRGEYAGRVAGGLGENGASERLP